MTPDPCPLNRAWCTAGDRDDDRHICQSTDLELPSGWTVTLATTTTATGPNSRSTTRTACWPARSSAAWTSPPGANWSPHSPP